MKRILLAMSCVALVAACEEQTELPTTETPDIIPVTEMDKPVNPEGEVEADVNRTAYQLMDDNGEINLNLYTMEQQIADRNRAAELLQAAAAQRITIEPGELPEIVAGVNIAAYARTTTHDVGDRFVRRRGNSVRDHSRMCRRFDNDDDAQRNFLANGGPQKDPLNLDPDGDGFACDWNPALFRFLR